MAKIRVEIEKAVFETKPLAILNLLTDIALRSESLEDAYKKMVVTNNEEEFKDTLELGKGGSHIWVSYRNNRILLITPNN